MLLLGVSGKLGAGKNFLVDHILPAVIEKLWTEGGAAGAQRPPPQIFPMAFGDQMKVDLAVRNPQLTYESLFVKKTQHTRELMQVYGTELCRKQYGEDVWIRSMNTWIEIYKARCSERVTPVFLISDVRFRNEVDWIQQRGGMVLRVEAPDRTQERVEQEGLSTLTMAHPSETDLDYYPFRWRIQNTKNTPTECVRKQVENALRELLKTQASR